VEYDARLDSLTSRVFFSSARFGSATESVVLRVVMEACRGRKSRFAVAGMGFGRLWTRVVFSAVRVQVGRVSERCGEDVWAACCRRLG
jgi:hypothetical protein